MHLDLSLSILTDFPTDCREHTSRLATPNHIRLAHMPSATPNHTRLAHMHSATANHTRLAHLPSEESRLATARWKC